MENSCTFAILGGPFAGAGGPAETSQSHTLTHFGKLRRIATSILFGALTLVGSTAFGGCARSKAFGVTATSPKSGSRLRLDYVADNQLITVTFTNAVQSKFVYDGLSRLRIRREYTWQANVWRLTNEVRYVYDHSLVIQERDSNNLAKATYTRGLDLSLSLQGAGGIGGLFALTQNGTTNQHYYYDDDGAGNVNALLDANMNQVAYYLYDPFGNQIFGSGPMAGANPYRFSSKEFLGAVGGYEFGWRIYIPNLGRWPNRDPIQEFGGLNLYKYGANDPINWVDPMGREIAYANHFVVNPYYHSKLIITPEDQACYQEDPRFQNVDENGNRYATIGAGPVDGNLVYKYNRVHDIDCPQRNKTSLSLPRCYKSENEAIDELFKQAQNYNKNPVHYRAFPKQDDPGYNSNSFISGLLESAGFQTPSPGSGVVVPGYKKPIPAASFQ